MLAASFFADTRSLGVVGLGVLLNLGFWSTYNVAVQRVTLATLTTLLLSSLVLPARRTFESRSAAGGASSTEPFVLEIILDEHIGLQGLRAVGDEAESLAREIQRFFRDRGFYLFKARTASI